MYNHITMLLETSTPGHQSRLPRARAKSKDEQPSSWDVQCQLAISEECLREMVRSQEWLHNAQIKHDRGGIERHDEERKLTRIATHAV